MASYGYNLVLVSRTMAQHTSFAAELVKIAKNNSSTITVELVALDLVDPRAPNELYTHCKRKNIRVDYLINCGTHLTESFLLLSNLIVIAN
jgi:short-subunit dehydrogenase